MIVGDMFLWWYFCSETYNNFNFNDFQLLYYNFFVDEFHLKIYADKLKKSITNTWKIKDYGYDAYLSISSSEKLTNR